MSRPVAQMHIYSVPRLLLFMSVAVKIINEEELVFACHSLCLHTDVFIYLNGYWCYSQCIYADHKKHFTVWS